MPNPLQRKVNESPSFTAEFQKLVRDKNDAKEILDGIKDKLSWKAEYGEQVTGTELMVTRYWDIPSAKYIAFYYQFDDKSVTILSALVGGIAW